MKIETLKDIQSLIDGRIAESTTLEYKRELGKSKKSNNEIAKDISAFANTDGGTIIYGVDEDDKRPISFFWLSDNGVDERIQNIAASTIQPKLSGVKVARLDNPENNLKAVYVVEISKSPEAPHMVKERYYRRSGSTSRPMDNIQVKNAMFGSGRLTALRYEVETNDKIMNQAFKATSIPMSDSYEQPIIIVPFHTDVWKSIVASGYVSVLNQDFTEALFDTYGLFDDINALCKIAMEDNTRFSGSEKMRFALSINQSSSTNQSSLGDAIRSYLRALNNSMKRLKGILKNL